MDDLVLARRLWEQTPTTPAMRDYARVLLKVIGRTAIAESEE